MADKIVTQDPTLPGVNKVNGPTITNGQVSLSGLSTSGAVANDVITLSGGNWIPFASTNASTASNLGAGVGVFSAKVGNDLQFKSLIAGSNITLTPTATDITIAASTAGAIVILQDQETAGTNGGTFVQAVWQTRVLNTEVADTGNNCVLGLTNQFTLLAGTYRCMIFAPAQKVEVHQARLRNITDGVTTASGTGQKADATGSCGNFSLIDTRFTIAASKVFEVQHQCGTTAANVGFGQAANFGETEVYTSVILWKE